ncbi:FAD-dependent oxidoreductase [Streptomyces sp. F63]|uniref:flavin monoamine oxidase family protein n=1 Tax=Streptomyces sp. F63 TaxID=2824887 RepID=UPI001B3875BA|nr:FAD-dependent oxidoreductase [Streptomyces sp. F63]MBQ0984800.1 FAD-dependent oxidoreductase [Streptomyces sp. F63]
MAHHPPMPGRRRFLAAAGGAVLATGPAAACTGPGSGDGRTARGGVPDPVAFLRTSWSTDPFALCSYSYLAPGPLGTSVRSGLAAPVGERLHFAGEATSGGAPATTAGALESGRRAAREILRSARRGRDTVVIGAGFAGLGCARALADAGVRVTVLEGRDRVGGRVWTERIAGAPAEMGASWIHGAEGNPVTDLLRRSGGRAHPFDYDRVVGGDEEAQAELARRSEKLAAVTEPDTTSVGDVVLPGRPSPGLRWAADVEFTQEYAAEPGRLAVSALDEGVGGSGGDVLLPGGYDRLVAELRGGLRVRTGTTVTAVRYGADGTRVDLDGGGSVRAGHCVVTVPIGVLKARRIAFDPPLPREKQAAVDALGAGLLDKLWLAFPRVFWDRDADALQWFDRANPGLWSWWLNGHKAFGKPVLLGFNSGRHARDLAERGDREVVAGAMAALRGLHA